jgi:HAD superfamily hydrolase (TIGR01450 family)
MTPKLPIPFLIDFDGVINLYNEPARYAKVFFDFIESHNLPVFILSNSTLRTSSDVKIFLEKYGLHTKIPIMTAADAALKYVEKNYEKVSVYCVENVKNEFVKFLEDKNPQAVVVGDLVDGWSLEVLSEIFLKVKNGADIIAMHMNRYWSPERDKYVLDAGSYISAIEYATEKKAVLIGKPSPIYFQTALEMLGYSKDTPFLMLGDDLELDITPVQKMGGKSVLILTGKTNLPLPVSASPNFVAKDLSEVIDILKSCYAVN